MTVPGLQSSGRGATIAVAIGSDVHVDVAAGSSGRRAPFRDGGGIAGMIVRALADFAVGLDRRDDQHPALHVGRACEALGLGGGRSDEQHEMTSPMFPPPVVETTYQKRILCKVRRSNLNRI